MDNGKKKYLRRVKNRLTCRRTTRNKLMSGLTEEIAGLGDTYCGYEQLVSQFDSPDYVAARMQETVSEDERLYAERSRRWIIIAAIVLAACVIAGSAISYARYIWNITPIYYTTKIVEGGSIETDSEGNEMIRGN
ncbi:MAG: hypothetical protein K5855_05145 [Oscillospiraceae bacterium]|jgi:hypothetical protein|nr:hypothetical protein [Oscillospiraceae bacterium]